MFAETAKRFGRNVRSNDAPIVAPGFLRPLDTDLIARDLKLDQLARERGEKNLPEPTQTNLDSVEQRIVQRIEGEWTWQGGELINNLRAYAARIVGYSIQAEFQKLLLAGNDALTRLRSANTRAEAELGPLKEAFVAARDELAAFRSRHRLNRSARNPSRRWITFGLLFVLVAVESVLNGFFFAKGSQFGLIGGIGTAIIISAANVTFAFLVGLGPARWIAHRNFFIRSWGLLCTIAGLIVLLSLHMFAVHFRDATASVGEDRAMSLAVGTLVSTPWKVSDINSIYLFVLGMLFGLGAFWKGYSFDDPYPRYGFLFRREIAAREAYSDEHAVLFEQLEDVKEDVVSTLRTGIEQLPLFPQMAAQIRAERAAMVQTFRGYEKAIETAINELLTRYRDKNRDARSIAAPAHFDSSWQLGHSYLDGAEVKTLTSEADLPPDNVAGLLSQLRELSSAILVEYERLTHNYPHPTQMR